MPIRLRSIDHISPKKRKPWNLPWVIFLEIIVLGLVGLRAVLPALAKDYANHILAELPGYYGHLDDISLSLWRGAYSIEGFELSKTHPPEAVPLVSAKKIDFSIHWNALWHGQLVGKIEIDHPRVNIIEDTTHPPATYKFWQEQAKKAFPLRISRIGIKDGEIHYLNRQATPAIDIFINHVYAVVTNLTNSRKLSKTLKATLDATAVAMQSGQCKIHTEIDPYADKPTFEYSAQLTNLSLPELGDFFKHYLAVDVKDGTLSFYSQGVCSEGEFKGYAKPLINQLDFIKIKENPDTSELAKAWVVKFVTYVMKNHPRDRLASRIDIEGTVKDPQADLWSAVSSFLHNWLIHAISPGLEGLQSIKNVDDVKP